MPLPKRRWLSYTLFALLLVALLPFLVLCLVFCLKLFLAALIITLVALLLIAGACLLYSAAWVASRMAQRPLPASRAGQDASSIEEAGNTPG